MIESPDKGRAAPAPEEEKYTSSRPPNQRSPTQGSPGGANGATREIVGGSNNLSQGANLVQTKLGVHDGEL